MFQAETFSDRRALPLINTKTFSLHRGRPARRVRALFTRSGEEPCGITASPPSKSEGKNTALMNYGTYSSYIDVYRLYNKERGRG